MHERAATYHKRACKTRVDVIQEDRARYRGEGLHVAIEATGVKYGGGAHVLLRVLGELLEDRRVGRVTVFASADPDRRWRNPDLDRVVIVEPPMVESPGWRVLWLEAGLANYCGQIKPDVVLCFNGVGYVGEEIAQVNLLQQPLLFKPRVLGKMPWAFRARMEVIRRLSQASCRRADRVIVQTPTVAALASSLFGLSLSTMRIYLPDIRWGEPARISDSVRGLRDVREDRRVLYVGSTIEYKRIDVAVKAVGRLRHTYEGLTLFATIPEDHEYAKLDWVCALGALSEGEVRACMELATLLVMPSLAETVGLPMVEAMSVGCPILASNLAYVHDVCEDAALCFLPGSVRSCMARMEHLLKDPILRHTYAGRGKIRAEKISKAEPYRMMVDELCQVALPESQKRERKDGSVA